jgi:glycosyltransferase involved in cell wall biosynthesis
MRLLIVSQYFWPENFRINDMACELVRRGHDVTVLCGTPNYPRGRVFEGFGWFRRTREKWNGVDIVRVPIVPRGNASGWRLAANYLTYVFSAATLGPLRVRGKFDAILTFQMSPFTMSIASVVMKRLRGAPILHWVQDLWPESLVAAGAVRRPALLKPIDAIVRWVYRAADYVLIQSRSFRDHVESRGIGAARIHYFPNTAEAFYEPKPRSAAHPALAKVPGGFRVMFAGNVGSVQDLPTVIAAAELTRGIPEIQWIIVGDGSMRRWVDDEVARRGLAATVHVLGQFAVDDMPAMFAGADAMLVTLRPDPFLSLTIPSKLQSYLASGKPVVGAIDGEGAAVIRDSGAGLSAKAGDARALADRVLELRGLPPVELEAMGMRGREYFQSNFESNMLLDRFETWCRELSLERARGRP